jgi:ABC-type Co2+ transport system permease subunit
LIAAVVAGGGVLGVLLGWLPEIALALVAIAVIVLLVPLSRGGCTGLVARGCVRVRPPRRRNGGVSEAT